MKTSVFISILLLFFSAKHKEIRKVQINGFAQGTTYHVTYYAPDSIVVKHQIDSILNKIDSSLSLYKPYSLINQFNSAKEGLNVDDHFKKVVNYALDTYRQTTGYFDITVYPLTDAWGFGPVKKMSSLLLKKYRACFPASVLIDYSGSRIN
jgi:FAD:protein FMN transferase